MNYKQLEALFEQHDEEFLHFDRVEKRRSKRPDLHAFLLLDEIFLGTTDMVSSAEHDEIWLAPSLDELPESLTEEVVIELMRCGVRLDETAYFCMFV